MAECRIITECCNSQECCGENITIGYLKDFIQESGHSVILDSSGNEVNVSTLNPDSYMPTYSELTGGTILPLFQDGGANAPSLNVDGIIISGTHSAGDSVSICNLSLKYTRFKNLEISSNKTTVDACGDNISATSDVYYTVYTKALRQSDCSVITNSTNVKENINNSNKSVTFSSLCAWVNNWQATSDLNVYGADIDKNGTWESTARTCDFSASLQYRGTTYQSDNTITINQGGLTGDYTNVLETTYSITVTANSQTAITSCDAVPLFVEADGVTTVKLGWQGTCGRDDSHYTYSSATEMVRAIDQFDAVICPIEIVQDETKRITVTYHGQSAYVDFHRDCSQSCPACQNIVDACTCNTIYPNDYPDAHGELVDKCGGDVYLQCKCLALVHEYGYSGGTCVETGISYEEKTIYAQVHIGENDVEQSEPKVYTGSVLANDGINTINYTIYQDGHACNCTVSATTYEYGDITVSAEACEESKEVLIPIKVTTYYDNCSPITTTSSYTQTVGFEVNRTNETKIYTRQYPSRSPLVTRYSIVTIVQAAGPCPCSGENTTYTYGDVSTTAEACDENKTVSIPYTATTTYDDCDPVVEKGVAIQFYTFGQNTSTTPVTHTYYYPDDTGVTQATITIVQGANCPCSGENTTYVFSNISVDCYEHEYVDVPYTATTTYTNCSATTSTGTSSYTANILCNDTLSAKTYSIATSLGNFTITQAAGNCCTACTCDMVTVNVAAGGNSVTFDWDADGDSKDRQIWVTINNYNCVTGVTTNISSLQHFDVTATSYSQTDTEYSILPKAKNTSPSDYVETLIFTYSLSDASPLQEPCTVEVPIIQLHEVRACSGKPCSEVTVTAHTTGMSSASASNVVFADYTISSCATITNVTVAYNGSESNWIRGLNYDNNTYRITGNVLSHGCISLTRTADITLHWMVDTTECSSSITVVQSGKTCDCSSLRINGTLKFNSDGSQIDPPTYSLCPDSCTLNLQGYSNVVSLNSYNGHINVTAVTNTSTTENLTVAIGVSVGNNPPCTQLNGIVPKYTCQCSDFNSVTAQTVTTNIPNTGSTGFTVWNISKIPCGGALTAISNNCNSLFDNIGVVESNTYYTITATCAPNTHQNDESCTIGYSYENIQTHETCKSGETVVTVAGTGECNCNSSNFRVSSYGGNVPTLGGVSIQIGTYTANCINNLVLSCAQTGINNIYCYNGGIYASFTPNYNSNSRSFNIVGKFNGDANSCQTLTVTQDACDCAEANLSVSPTLFNVSSGQNTYFAVYSINCDNVTVSSENDWITPSIYGGQIAINVSENTSDSSRNGTVRVHKEHGYDTCYLDIIVTQEAGSGSTEECKCTNANLQLVCNQSVPYSASNNATIAYFTASCISNLSFTVSQSYVTNPRIGTTGMSGAYITGTVVANITQNTSSTSRSITVVALINNVQCTSNIGYQSQQECTCSSSNFAVNPTSTTVSSGGGAVNISYTSNCGTVSAVTSSSWITGLTHNSNYIRIAYTQNTGTTSRSATVIIYHCNTSSTGCSTGDCYSAVTITQLAGAVPCTCNNLNIVGMYTTSGNCYSAVSSSNSQVIATYTGNCGNITGFSSTQSWIHNISAGGGNIYAVIDTNCGAMRNATITVRYTANGSQCTSKTFDVWQCAGGYISITPSNASGDGCSTNTVNFTANPRQ